MRDGSVRKQFDFQKSVNFKYRDENEQKLAMVMPNVNLVDVLNRLGTTVASVTKDEVIGYCPDHEMHTGRKPSHPKWSCNKHTGITICATEGRGSNIAYIICRLRKCSYDEALSWMLGSSDDFADLDDLKMASFGARLKHSMGGESSESEQDSKFNPASIEKDVKEQIVHKNGYEFFIQPPNKPATEITKETVDKFRCFQRTNGYYRDRVVVPFFQYGKIKGFSAIDILGIDKWLRKNPSKTKDDYKKTLYPKGFKRAECLFGFDEVEENCDTLFLTEGAREVMKISQFGYNAVSVLGIYVSAGHILLLTEINPKEIVIVLDGDVAGYRASEKMTSQLEEFFNVRWVRLPYGKDPKNLSKEKFDELVKPKEKKVKTFSDFLKNKT